MIPRFRSPLKASPTPVRWGALFSRALLLISWMLLGAGLYALTLDQLHSAIYLLVAFNGLLIVSGILKSRIGGSDRPLLPATSEDFTDPVYQAELDEAIRLGFRVYSRPLITSVLDQPALLRLHQEGLVITGAKGLEPSHFTEMLDTASRRRVQIKRLNRRPFGHVE